MTTAAVSARMEAARTALNAEEEREQQATLERAVRNQVQEKIDTILRVYRLKVAAISRRGVRSC